VYAPRKSVWSPAFKLRRSHETEWITFDRRRLKAELQTLFHCSRASQRDVKAPAKKDAKYTRRFRVNARFTNSTGSMSDLNIHQYAY
jgi:hypothetical protein